MFMYMLMVCIESCKNKYVIYVCRYEPGGDCWRDQACKFELN